MSHYPHKLKQGAQAFNQGEFYLAHEHFEDAWREDPHQTREFFRALLHLSGGYYRLTQDRVDAAQKFFHRSLYWIAQFPSPYYQIDTAALESHLNKIIAAIDSGQSSERILQDYAYQIQSAGLEVSS